jgi:hypothetical protein
MRKTILLLALLIPVSAAAQHSFELTPTLGYRWGGSFKARTTDILEQDVDVNSDASIGLLFDVSLNRFLDLELMIDHQSTDLGERRLWGPSQDNPGIDITYYHAGLLFQWPVGRSKMFVVGGMGMADLDLDLPGAGSESRFSTSFGGGVKLDLSHRLGLRLEVRGFWSDTGSGSWWDCGDDYHGCHDCWDDCDWGRGDLVQGEVKLGLIIKL